MFNIIELKTVKLIILFNSVLIHRKESIMADQNILIQQKNSSRSYDKLYPFSPPVQYVNYTLSGSSWSSGTYSFESTYPNSKYNLSISVSSTATSV